MRNQLVLVPEHRQLGMDLTQPSVATSLTMNIFCSRHGMSTSLKENFQNRPSFLLLGSFSDPIL